VAHADPPELPPHTGIFGLALFATIALPLFADVSMLGWLLFIAERDLIAGVLALLTWGSPFLFGLAVALASAFRKQDATGILMPALQLLHLSLLLFAIHVLGDDDLALRHWFVGFVLVSYYHLASLDDPTSPRAPPTLRELVRLGGVVLTGTSFWLHFQTFDTRPLGVAIHVAFAASFLLVATLPRDAATSP
jgi:hypothetical protein